MGRIIVVEDNLTFSGYVCRLLESKGFQTISASTCNGARKLFAKMCEDDIVLADLRLNDGDGILLLEELRKQRKRNPYIVMTDYDEVPTAVRSMKSGAEDYIPKKLLEMSLPPLLKTLRERMERHEPPIYERQSAAFREIDRKIKLVAPTSMSVLVLGENGTGKEHVAEKIHAMSKRSGKPLWRWTAACCQKNLPHQPCSDTRKAHLRARKTSGKAIGRKPTEARCSLTR
jgi:two-component system response regulator HydG